MPPSSPPPFDAEAVAPEAIPGVRLLPVVHERVDLAPVVRGALEALDPAVVAVELPTPLGEVVERAIRRLPKISLVLSRQSGEEALLWVVAPGDPLAEALRWAHERGRRGVLIDPDVPYVERHHDPVPDTQALWTLGPAAYLDLLCRATGSGEATAADAQREAGMAHRLQSLRRELDAAGDERPVVAVVGAAHALRLAARLPEPAAAAFARPRRQEVMVRHLAPESLAGLMADYPLLHAAWERLRPTAEGDSSDGPSAPAAPGDPLGAAPDEALLDASVSRPTSVMRYGLRVVSGGAVGDEGPARRRALAAYVARRAARSHGPPKDPAAPVGVDRKVLPALLWQVAALSYRAQTQERPAVWQRRLFLDFGRRYVRQRGRLVPDLFELVVAARGVADDNFAWELYDAARAYPGQHGAQDLEIARVDGDELDLGTHKIRFRRRFLTSKSRPVSTGLRQRAETSDPSTWLSAFDGETLCSYPKEDVVIEDYGRFLKRKAVSILTAENRRVEPFSTSLLDGIDLRETLRNAHQGRLWVQEMGRAPGGAGSVVVIFDADLENRYSYRMTWHGEHKDESDMAFYSTLPHEQVVGPGIMRATYGGFLMTYPPGRLWDVWDDGDYDDLANKAEVLLAAAVDYSFEPLVVHVGPSPPSSRSKQRAALRGKRIVHIPLATLSPVALKRLRVVHLLSGHDKRAEAGRYIW